MGNELWKRLQYRTVKRDNRVFKIVLKNALIYRSSFSDSTHLFVSVDCTV